MGKCPKCEELDEVAEKIMEILKSHGIVGCDCFIVIGKGGCHKTMIPNCNMDIIFYVQMKILDRLVAEGQAHVRTSTRMDIEAIRKEVSEYLDKAAEASAKKSGEHHD
jgi:hypothetical protein